MVKISVNHNTYSITTSPVSNTAYLQLSGYLLPVVTGYTDVRTQKSVSLPLKSLTIHNHEDPVRIIFNTSVAFNASIRTAPRTGVTSTTITAVETVPRNAIADNHGLPAIKPGYFLILIDFSIAAREQPSRTPRAINRRSGSVNRRPR
ncbi:MAG: hypothetical protein FD165_2566 [Gammaproteobacteria bacterium]|nr:MAG: hypothetical protein FD165_2566 [Gammaproteobacteria bacterium]